MLRHLTRYDPTTRSGRVWLDMWRVARLVLLKAADPVVIYPFEGHSLRLPFSHDLPVIRQQCPQYMTALTRLVRHVASKYPNANGLDIGANVGDTIAAIRAGSSMPILAVEGSSEYFRLLRENTQTLPQVELEGCFVSYQVGELSGVFRKQSGTAHFVPGTEHGAHTQKTLHEIIGAHPEFCDARFVKLDTDGFDCAILISSLEWLAQAAPVVYFEYDPAAFGRYDRSGYRVFERMRSIGYRGALIWDNRGDFLLSCDLRDDTLIEELHGYFSGRAGKVYCDIAMFHASDDDLMRSVRAGELQFFSQFREAPLDDNLVPGSSR